MKNLIKFSFLIIVSGFLFSSCSENSCEMEYTYTKYKPIYMTNEEVAASVASETPRPLENPGKIFFSNNRIFIGESNEGVHVIDNSDPTNPTNIAFIKIPGNIDVAVKGDVLYADMYTDLISLDISNVHNVSIIDQEIGVFDEYTTMWFYGVAEEGQIIVDWELAEVTEVVETDCHGNPLVYPGGGEILFDDGFVNVEAAGVVQNSTSTFTSSDVSATSGRTTGTGSGGGAAKGGSMARFACVDNMLYVIDGENLKTFDIADPANLSNQDEQYVGWGLETIFPYDGGLFIGTMTGMFIYDISNLSSPMFEGTYDHMTACDPVVVDNDIAYVTLRSGNNCWRGVNELQLVDVSDRSNPQLIVSYPMTNPHGLGVDGSLLFLCDGDDGLKIFDKTDNNAIDQNMIDHFQDINSFDVIPINSLLMMTGSDGIYQYNYSANSITELSVIPVQ